VKSLQLEQKPIDPIEQGESAKDPPLETKLKNRRLKLSFKKFLNKYEKIVEANVNNQPKKVQ
jgi:hypothetical protein